MDVAHIRHILKKGEGISVEFKKAAGGLLKNPHIAKFFVQMGRAEELGTGIRKVYKYSRLYSGADTVFWGNDLFEVAVPLPSSPKTTPKTKDLVIRLILENPSVSKHELAKQLRLSEEGVRYHLNKLKKEGLIHYEGSSKKGKWVLLNPKN